MTNEVTAAELLKAWWDQAGFPGKEYCDLNENGELILKKSPNHPQRTLATLTPDNASALVKAMTEKFEEVQERVRELMAEWEAATDKLKLLGKVARTRDYLLHTNTIGDFDPLLRQIQDCEGLISQLTEENYRQKLALVERAETLCAETQSWKEATQELKELNELWKQIGYLEKHRNDDLWNRMEAARELFHDRKRKYQEAHEKELLQNLDLKLEIIEKAEALAVSESWKETTEVFKNLMDQWKAVGRTMPDKNEELWNRFIQAKNQFFERKRQHFEVIKAEQEANYQQKLALVEQAEAMKDSTDWSKTSNAYATLMDHWKRVGRVPMEKADELWGRLTAAKEVFYGNKRQHTEAVRVAMEDNLARKQALVKRAEELKHANQWREATEEMNELLAEWKKIGPVPREHMDSLWEQFITARKFFFDRKDADRERRKQQYEQQQRYKNEKMNNFLVQIEAELAEEQEKLADFQTALQNVTPGNKEEELRAHLEKLIRQCETKIRHKEEKINEVKKQAEELEAKKQTAGEPNEQSAATGQ